MGNPRWPFYPCRRFFEHGFAWNFPILTREHFSRPMSHAMELLPSFIVSSASITISVLIVCTHYPGEMPPIPRRHVILNTHVLNSGSRSTQLAFLDKLTDNCHIHRQTNCTTMVYHIMCYPQ